jgi:predicted nucleic acid-binding protein
MSARSFVDTNVLLYAHDVDAGQKHTIAKRLLQDLWEERSGVLSTQVLQEFYVNVTRKIRTPIPPSAARGVVNAYGVWCAAATDLQDIAAAFQIEDEARIGFWDALIVAVAARSGAARLLSEDLNAGQTIAGITIENPFAAASTARPS